jgi:hypothetical protein
LQFGNDFRKKSGQISERISEFPKISENLCMHPKD